MARSAARAAPVRCVCQVWPPSCVAKMLPRAPAAQPCSASTKCSACSGADWPVAADCQVLPLSAEWKMRVPGEPAIQTCGPSTATAWKSKWSVADSGSDAGGVCQLWPRSLVVINESAVADGPTAGWCDESHRAEGT